LKLSIDLEIVFGYQYMNNVKAHLDVIKSKGIDVFEIWNHKLFDIQALMKAAKERNMHLSCLSGNRDYNLLESEYREQLIEQLKENIQVAKMFGAQNVSMLSEILNEDTLAVIPTKREMSDDAKLVHLFRGLEVCTEIAEKEDIVLNLETLNSQVDHAGYFCTDIDMSMEILRAINSPCLKSLFDIYHIQIMQGNIIERIEKYLPWIGEIHIADVPGRHEPGTGEINYKNVAKCLKENGYDGYVVLEGSPSDQNPQTAIDKFIQIFG